MIKFLLFPFALTYDLVTRVRNYLYDRGLKPSIQFDLPVISVGNLTVGGTGKTPMVEYLVRLLSQHYTIATLSRGYGRKTKGFRLASESDTAETLGDEPMQYYQKFGSDVAVAVGEERALAIPLLLQERETLDVVLLDDAFQHRRVRPSFNLLLCDFNRPFYEDMLLPSGRLRESASGATRADAIVVTKCPEHVSEDALLEIERRIRSFAAKPVFFSAIAYGSPVGFTTTSSPFTPDIVLVTGLADATPLLDYVRSRFNLMRHIEFADHHNYSESDIDRIISAAGNGVSVLTTEKDRVKIDVPSRRARLQNQSFFYLPIAVQFLKGQLDFEEMIRSHVRDVSQKNRDELRS